MRTQHILYTVPNFPIYSAAFVSNDVLVLGGGGGSSKTGVKNMIRLYKVQLSLDLDMKLLDEYPLHKEDTPMSMSAHQQRSEIICGINGLLDDTSGNSEEIENCRAFAIRDTKIKPLNTRTTFKAKTPEDYQNVTVFSPDYDFLAIGSTTNEVTLLSYPDLKPLGVSLQVADGQLYDVVISSHSLIVVATTRLDIYSLPVTGSSKRPVKTVTAANASIPGLTFRAARFDPKQPQYMYTVMNATPSRSGRKVSSRYSYLLKWNMEESRVIKARQVVDKAITCFDMSRPPSSDGKLVAVGCSDFSIRVFDTHTLTPFLTILKAHEFPPTTIRFNTDGSLLISASFDNTVRVVAIPEKGDTGEHRLYQSNFVLKSSSHSHVKKLVCLNLDVASSGIRGVSPDNSGFGLNQQVSLIFAAFVTSPPCLWLRIKIDGV